MIVIPFAGLSNRFKDAGYLKPKFMLDLDGKSVFEHSLRSFEKYFRSEEFIFIGRDIEHTTLFIEECISKLRIKSYRIVLLEKETRGQAETVYLGLKKLNLLASVKLIIFNIDTFRNNFMILDQSEMFDGYLEVFEGSGFNWSYVLPDSENIKFVSRTAEKEAISSLCCTGLYVFSNHFDFLEAFEYFSKHSILFKNEFYVAPLYNYLISSLKKSITYKIVDQKDIIFCGIPAEYEQLKLSKLFKNI